MSAEFRNLKKYKTINGKKMAYIEEGEGDPIVFLHVTRRRPICGAR